MKKRYIFIAFITLSCLSVKSQVFRSTLAYEHNWDKKLESDFQLGLRIPVSTDQEQLYGFALAGIGFEPLSWLKFTGDFRYGMGQTLSPTDYEDEDFSRIRLGADMKLKLAPGKDKLIWHYRLRYQYGYYSDEDHKYLLRNRIKAEKKFNKHLKPYVLTELYYNLDSNKIKKTRLEIGSEFKMAKSKFELHVLSDLFIDNSTFFLQHSVGIKYYI